MKDKQAAKGVDCFTCHQREAGAVDAMDHFGFRIGTLVTPKDCSRCHAQQVKEMTSSHHAKAGDILNSLDNFLGEAVGGPEAVTSAAPNVTDQKSRYWQAASSTPTLGRIRASVASIPTDRSARARPATPVTIFRRRRRASRKHAASAISVRIIRRSRSTRNRSTASCTPPTRRA